jgi:hypothetical protein
MQRRKVHWFYIDLQMVFGTLIREALWWKLGKSCIN